MDREQLRQHEPFFGGFFVYEELGSNSEYASYRVRKQLPDGRSQYAVIRDYSFPCGNALTGNAAYPARLRRLISDTDMMLRLQNCANIVRFYEKTLVPTQSGYDFLILTQDVAALETREHLDTLPKAEAYAIASAVCEAVSSFRSLGITHRRICPENIFCDSTGGYLLGDFGIGGTYVAEEDYLTPEEHRVSADISSVDVYQTGMLLYKLLNKNRGPFLPAYPIEITQENRRNAFMRRMNGEVPAQFEGSNKDEEDIISKACAFSPSERYRNIATFKSDIDALLKKLAPSGVHDYYYMGGTAAHASAEAQQSEEGLIDEEETYISDSAQIVDDYPIDDFDSDDESAKIIKALIISIIVIAVLAAGIIAYTAFSRKNREETTLPATQPSTTESTTSPTTTTTEPTTTTTESTTESTTEPTTESTTQSTTESTTESTTQATTQFTLPEGFTWFTTESTEPVTQVIEIDSSKAEVTAFEDDGRIDEIVVAINHTFGDSVSADANVLICEYSDGRLVRTCYAETECMYEENDTSRVICDILVPTDFVIDTENYTYRLVFQRELISGHGYTNSEFAVNFDASALD